MAEPERSDDVRKRNRGRVLAALRRHGALSRKDISATTSLSPSTVSAITSELLEEDVICIAGGIPPAPVGRGRPQVQLALNPDAALVASAVVKLDRISATVSNYAGEKIAVTTSMFRPRRASPEAFFQFLTETLRTALGKVPQQERRLTRIRIGVQGATDVRGSSMLWSPITPHRNLQFKQVLESEFGVPVHVSNDCNMMARALHWQAPDLFDRNFAAVLMSNGIGMGLMLNGELVKGTRSSGAEFGHLSHVPDGALCRCGRRGCIEAYAGDYAIYRRAHGEAETTSPRNDISQDDMDAVREAAARNDPQALSAYREAGQALGTGLADMFALVDSFPVAFIGNGTAAFEYMEEPLRTAIAATRLDALSAAIEIHCFPDDIPLIQEGCAVTALQEQDDQFAHTAITAVKATA